MSRTIEGIIRHTKERRRLFLGVALIFCLTPESGIAQTVPPPPITPKIDANGIDVRTGNEMWDIKALSIGPEGGMGLEYVISQAGGVTRDNFSNTYHTKGDAVVDILEYATFGAYGDSIGPGTVPTFGRPGRVYQTQDGAIVTFDILADEYHDGYGNYQSTWYANSITFPNGVKWDLHYKASFSDQNAPKRLQSVTSNTGYQIKFIYESNYAAPDRSNIDDWHRRISAIAINNAVEYCDPMADSCSLSQNWPQSYDSKTYNSLTQESGWSITDASGAVTQIRSKNMGQTFYRAMRRAGSSVDDILYNFAYVQGTCMYEYGAPEPVACQYGHPWRVTSVVTPEKTVSYAYNTIPDRFVVTATEPDQTTNRYEMPTIFTGALGILKWVDRGGTVMSYENNLRGEQTKVVWPEGNRRELTLGACDAFTSETIHPKTGDSSPPISQSRTLATHGENLKLCGKVLSTTDPRGNTTAYTYDPAHGGVLTELSAPDGNGVRPAKKYYYEQRYARTKDAGGSFVQKATPVWLLTEIRTCKTSTMDLNAGTCGAGSSDLVRTEFDYGPTSGGPSNLLMRGKVEDAGGLALRTCFGYDIYGRQISETRSRAGLTSCP